MSGIEIAGIVLGALPVVFGTLDGYAAAMARIRRGLRKRKYVESLVRSLQMQKQTLEMIVKIVLVESGCHSSPPEDGEMVEFLKGQSVKECVKDYLGEQKDLAFIGAITECSESLYRAICKVAAYVPSLKVAPEVQALMSANNANKQNDWRARIAVVLGANVMDDEVNAIDESINRLHRFVNLLRTWKQLEASNTSPRATKLARSLLKVQQYADSLHCAIKQCWQDNCHVHHEAKLFLDARIPSKSQKDSACQFRIVLSCDPWLSTAFCHEIAISVLDEQDQDYDLTSTSGPRDRQVRIAAPASASLVPNVEIVSDLCSALSRAERSQKHPILHMTQEKKIGMVMDSSKPFISSRRTKTITLKEILDRASNSPSAGRSELPLRSRMELALKLGSGFLQFLRTPWSYPGWSASGIHFHVDAQQLQPDLVHPHLSVCFNQTRPSDPFQQDLLTSGLRELGILLLEIWHGKSFEAKFSTEPPTISSSARLDRAVSWLEEVDDPPFDQYNAAIERVLWLKPGMSAWDDMQLWKEICAGVVEPLNKVIDYWKRVL